MMARHFRNLLFTGLALSVINAPAFQLSKHSVAGTQNRLAVVAKTESHVPLWPGSRFTEADRREAVLRGVRFIYRTALRRESFDDYGSDYLWCLYTISASVRDRRVSRMARRMAIERARRWRQTHRRLPVDATADDVLDFAFGSDAADSVGVRDEKLKQRIRRAATRFSVIDFLSFDPTREPPPADVPEECEFDETINLRGSKVCSRCGRPLEMRSRYDLWCEALVTAYTGDHYGVKLGANYVDVLKWLPTLRHFPSPKGGVNQDFSDALYAVTHVVYTLNDYEQSRLAPQLLPDEFQFLKASLRETIALGDPDMLGELMDSLRSFGLKDGDEEIKLGMDYLLTHQNKDGSWGNEEAKDIFGRYHPTWNGVAGLSNYAWRGTGPDVARLRLLTAMKRTSGSSEP